MNSRDHEELLSAYHDGELAGGERADVEQWLAEDESARDILEEIADLSRVLADCPRPAAPPELYAGVMEQVRQAAPVRAAGAPAARPSHASAAAARPSRRYWAWSAATVAGLFVAVLTFQYVMNANAPIGGVAATEQAAPAVAETTGDASPPRSAALPPPSLPDVAAADASPPLAMAPADAALDGSADLQDLEVAVSSGSPPQIGETLKRLIRDGEKLRVVQYTVLDIRQAFGQMQVLLEENGIRTITPEGAVMTARPPQSGELLAIVVEAIDEKLDVALTAMGEDSSVRGMLSSELADVTTFPLSEPETGLESLLPPSPAAGGTRPKPAAVEPPPAEKATDPSDPPRGTAARSTADDDIAVPIGVPLTPELMQSVLPIEAAQRQDRARRQPRGGGPARATADDPARTPAAAPRTRILIVLVPERTEKP